MLETSMALVVNTPARVETERTDDDWTSDQLSVECDCCVPGVAPTCIIFFFSYLIIFAVTVIALVQYRDVRQKIRQPIVLGRTTKFWIIVGVLALQFVRIVQFSTVWFNHLLDKKTDQTRCVVEWTTNIPMLLEFINVFVVHEFLLRTHLVLTNQLDKWRLKLIIYTATLSVIYTASIIADSSVYCARTSMIDHSRSLKIVAVCQAVYVLIANPIFVTTVLRSLSRVVGKGKGNDMLIKIAILGILFEITFSLRIVLVLKQDEWKRENPSLYNIIFTIYIIVGEIGCQIVLILGLIAHTRKMRNKLKRSSLLNNSADQQQQQENEEGPIRDSSIAGTISHEISTTEENRRLTMQLRLDVLLKKTEITEGGNSVLDDEEHTDNVFSSMQRVVTHSTQNSVLFATSSQPTSDNLIKGNAALQHQYQFQQKIPGIYSRSVHQADDYVQVNVQEVVDEAPLIEDIDIQDANVSGSFTHQPQTHHHATTVDEEENCKLQSTTQSGKLPPL